MTTEIRKNKVGICWANVIAICTVPIEGLFFFGAITSWPSLAEIYKSLGIRLLKHKVGKTVV